MRQIQLPQEHYKFRTHSGADSFANPTLVEILKSLKTIRAPHENVRINVVIGNNNIVGDNNQAAAARASPRDWIIANPPILREATMDYYRRYLAGNPEGVSIQKFTPEVLAQGHKKQHAKINYWIPAA